MGVPVGDLHPGVRLPYVQAVAHHEPGRDPLGLQQGRQSAGVVDAVAPLAHRQKVQGKILALGRLPGLQIVFGGAPQDGRQRQSEPVGVGSIRQLIGPKILQKRLLLGLGQREIGLPRPGGVGLLRLAPQPGQEVGGHGPIVPAIGGGRFVVKDVVLPHLARAGLDDGIGGV